MGRQLGTSRARGSAGLGGGKLLRSGSQTHISVALSRGASKCSPEEAIAGEAFDYLWQGWGRVGTTCAALSRELRSDVARVSQLCLIKESSLPSFLPSYFKLLFI